MEKLLSKEAEQYHILNSEFNDYTADINTINKDIRNTLQKIKENIGIWDNIDVNLAFGYSDLISKYKKKTYKKPDITLYYSSIESCVSKYRIPTDLIIENGIYFSLCEALVEWDKKENIYLLNIEDDIEIYCEQFAYNLYCRNLINEDVKSMLSKINEDLTGHLPLLYLPNDDTFNMPNGDVKSIFGTLGGNKKKNLSDFPKQSVSDDAEGNMYTEDEIYDIIQKYKIWCLQNNKKPINTENLRSKELSYIKNIVNS